MYSVIFAILLTLAAAQQIITQCPGSEQSQAYNSGNTYKTCPNTDFQVPSTQIIPQVSSLQQCVQLCDGANGCFKAVFDTQNFVCHLKGNPSNANWVSSTQYQTIYRSTSQATGSQTNQCPVAVQTLIMQSGRTCQICNGTDYSYPSSAIIPSVGGYKACVQNCDAAQSCAYASYDSASDTCHIKGGSSAAVVLVANPNFLTIQIQTQPASTSPTGLQTQTQPASTSPTGLSKCPGQSSVQTLLNGRQYTACSTSDYQGDTAQAFASVTNIAACAQACASALTCSKAVYDQNSQMCFLKNNATTQQWVSSPQYSTISLGSTSNTGSSSAPAPPSLSSSRLPIMGYNSYNHVGCNPTNDNMNASMTALQANGFLALGYKYFQIDCGWQGYNRLPNGSITYDAQAFPYGIKPLSDRARQLGFKWSMYTDQGVYSCDTSSRNRPGSLGFETQDAAMFAAWNTEYVKVDNCYVDAGDNAPKAPRTDFPSRFGALWNALLAVNIPNMLVCQWGTPYMNTSTNTLQGPYSWAPQGSTSFRLTDDIAFGTVSWLDVLRIYNQAIHLNLQGRPTNSIPDLDLLEVGNAGLTIEEQKTHFAIWAAFKSALMISTDPTNMSPQTKAILGNTNLIAVNQDPLGAPVKLVQRFSNDHDVFLGPLSNGDQVVLIVNHASYQQNISLSFNSINFTSATVQDLWSSASLGSLTSISQTIAPHGSMVLRLSNIVPAPVSAVVYQYVEAESASLTGGAGIAPCVSCSNGNKVGGLTQGSQGKITFTNLAASQTTLNVLFDYINADIQFLWSQTGNNRAASISVNGGSPVTVLFPVTGYDWNGDVLRSFKVQLSGFNPGSSNTIAISAVAGQLTDAPDLDRIAIPQ